MSSKQHVLAVIMGGGRGARLYPLTKERCKPAVPLAGKYRLVDIPISNCLNSGINRIFLLSQFQTASLHRHIRSTYYLDAFGGGFVDILAAEQTEKTSNWYQGTADAVRRNLQHFRAEPHDYVLILSGDQLYRMDFRPILQQHIQQGADVTIAALPVPADRLEGMGLLGISDACEIQQFAEKPKDPKVIESLLLKPQLISRLPEPPAPGPLGLASMGIYVFNRNVLAEALDNQMTDFGKEIIPALLGRKKLCAHLFSGYWEDIGTVRAFFEANLALAQPLPPFNFFDEVNPIYNQNSHLPACKINQCNIDYAVIGDGSLVEDSFIKHSVLGIRSFVRSGCVLEDVVMMGSDHFETPEQLKADQLVGRPHLGLGHGCRIHRAIIDKNARIGDGACLSPAGKADGDYSHGIVIRDGVLVVAKGLCLPPGTTL